jgi:hypothetical protein
MKQLTWSTGEEAVYLEPNGSTCFSADTWVKQIARWHKAEAAYLEPHG